MYVYACFDRMPVPILVVDEDHKIVFANAKAKEVYGFHESTCYGLTHHYSRPCYEEGELCPVKIMKDMGKSHHHVVHIHTVDGEEEFFYVLACYDESIQKTVEMHIELEEVAKAFQWSNARPELLFSTGPSVVFLWENAPGWPVRMVSPNVEKLFGYTAEDFISGRVSYAELIHPEDLERVAQEVEENTQKKSKSWTHQDYRIITKDGKVKWLLDHTVPVFDQEGNITHYYGYVMDVSERHEKEEVLLKVAQMSPVGILIHDPYTGEVVFVNERAKHILEVVEGLDGLRNIKRRMLKVGRRYYKVESSTVYHEGRELILSILTDITQEKLFEKKLYKLATKDKLTGIYNRHALTLLLEKLLSYAQRNSQKLALILFDIDNFKRINDTYGHAVGDEVLKSVARVVKKVIRRSDIFGRWGGEEFLVILPHTEEPLKVAEKIRKAVEERVKVKGEKVTVSLGAVSYRERDTMDSILSRADLAMYSAKSMGKNTSVYVE